MSRRFNALFWSCAGGIVSVQQICFGGNTLNEVSNFTTTGNFSSTLYSSQYNLLFVRDSAAAIRVLNPTTGAQLNLRSPSATGGFTDFTFSPSGRYLFAADYGGTNIGYDTPANPSYVNRYDLQTGTWSTAQAPAIGYRIAAVDDSRVLLLGVDQWVDLTLNTYASGAMSQLSKISPGYSGNVEYSASTGRIIYNETGISSTLIRGFTLSGNTIASAESVNGTSYNGTYGVLSSDGNSYYYGQREINASDLTKTVATFSESIGAAAPTMAFGATHYYNPVTGAVLGAVGFTPANWTVDANGRDVWAVQTSGTSSILHHYVIALSTQWSSPNGGSWVDTSKWSPTGLPDGIDNTADLSQTTLAADATVTLDGNHTVGHLILGDLGAARNWTVAPGTGGVLTMQVSGGTPNITVSNQTATVNATIDGTQGLLKDGAGTLVLGANNTYSGGTTLSSGTLMVNADGNLGTGPLSVGAGTFRVGGNISSARAIGLQSAGATVQVDNGFSYTALSGATVSGTGSLTKSGAGTLDLTAASVGYTGATTVNGGTLNLNSFASTAQVTVASGAVLNVAGANLTLGTLANSGNTNFTNTSGAITLATVSGTGTTTFAAGATIPTLSGGTVTVAGPANITSASAGVANLNGASNTIATLGNTAINLGSGTALSVGAGTQTAGGITGAGSLTKTGAGTLTLGFDNAFAGGTTVSAGTLQIGNGATAGSISGNILDNATLVFTRSDTYAFAGQISGSGAVRQSGTGTLTLSGANNYSGGTTIASGTLLVNADNLGSGSLAITGGTFRVGGNITSGRSISLQSTTSAVQVDGGATYTGTATAGVSGTGGLVKSGLGTLDLSAASVSYTGTTTVNAGVLTLGSFASTGTITTATGATLNLSPTGLTLGTVTNAGTINFTGTSGVITVGGLSGNGTASFAAGATIPTLSAGTISVAGPASITTASGGSATFSGTTASMGTLSNTSVSLVGGTALSVSSGTQTAGGVSGAGSLIKTSAGTLILAVDNTYTGGTTVSGGTLQIGNGGAAGSLTGNLIDSGSLVFNRSDAYTFAGQVTGTGALTKSGAGTLSLINANSYAGGTTISSGTLQLGDGTAAGSVVGNVTDNGALVFNTPAAGQTFVGAISGTGSISKIGTGTQVLTGNNSASGGITVSAGVLQIGDGGTGGSIAGSVSNDAALVFKRSDNVNFTGAIQGAGRIEQAGAGTLSLLGNVTNNLQASNGRVVVGSGSTFSGDLTTTATGRVENGGGTIHVANFDNAGIFSGTADAAGTFLNRSTGDVRLAAGQSFLAQANVSHLNQGLIEALGNGFAQASFEAVGLFTNASGGTALITGRNATVRFDNGLTNQGAVALSSGVNDVFGDVNNVAGGSISVAGGAGVTFYDDVIQNGSLVVSAVGSTHSSAVFLGGFSGAGGFTGGGDVFVMGDLRPGNSPASVTYGGNLYLGTGSATVMELAGLGQGEFDQMNVTGALGLDGALQIAFYNGFAPAPGETFDLINAGSTSGAFSSVSLPTLPSGMNWDTSKLYTDGTVSVVPEPAALSLLVMGGMAIGRRRRAIVR